MQLLIILLSLVTIPGSDSDTVYVHEWGVIVLDEPALEARGASWGHLGEDGYLEPWPEYEVEAPVVWMHGAECSGILTVRSVQGYFTALYPYPDSLGEIEEERMPAPEYSGGYRAQWSVRTYTVMPVEEDEEALHVAHGMEGYGWAAPYWREVEASYLSVPGSDFLDRFIYYECTASSIQGISHDCTAAPDTYGFTGEALVFRESGGELVAEIAHVGDGEIETGFQLNPLELMAVLRGWGEGLHSSELQALWRTWEPEIERRCFQYGDTLLLFPMDREQTESISTLDFQPDEGDIEVEYSRLFLGIGAV